LVVGYRRECLRLPPGTVIVNRLPSRLPLDDIFFFDHRSSSHGPDRPVTRRQPFNDRNWLFEFKYDGFPSVLYLTRQECMFYSKRGWEIS
jgi:hypothetical protein